MTSAICKFQSLPVWRFEFSSLRVFQRDDPIASVEIVRKPHSIQKQPTQSRAIDPQWRSGCLIKALTPLALANPPPANDAKQLAGNMAHAARLVRSIVEDRLTELKEAGEANAPLQDVRDEFPKCFTLIPGCGLRC